MSTTLSTASMVTKLQLKLPIGIGNTQWMDLLNEAFRQINQMSKGGFIWQVVFNNPVTIQAGARAVADLPNDFDPGKDAWLYGNTTQTQTQTLIPYKSIREFLVEEHFESLGIGQFSCWTFFPNFTYAASSFRWYAKLAPESAWPLPAPVVLPFFYHQVTHAPLAYGAGVYFPTPDQFDNLIMDLAEAEARRQYSFAGWEKIAAEATQSLSEMVDTYRTNRFSPAGLTDVLAQAQERQASGDK